MKKALFSFVSSAARYALLLVAGSAMLTTFASHANAGTVHFGVRCQSDFQNGWAPTVDVYGACSNFISEIQPVEYVDFYFNLHGAQNAFYSGQAAETCNGCGGADSVDFFFMITHGTIANNNANYAGFAMWDDTCGGGCVAWVPSMRFGSVGQQMKAFATFSCDTLKYADGLLWTRWQSVFRGGLKVAVGGFDLLYTSNDGQAGTNFAANMRSNYAIGYSWLNSVYYANNSNHPIVANTGANSTDCNNRQNSITVNNLQTATPLRDGQVGYYCYTYWN
jgi:hypothetical protein